MKPSLSKMRNWALSAAMAIFAVVLTAEACGLAWFGLERGKLFYFRPSAGAQAPSPLAVTQSVIHPLFGYVLRPGAQFHYQGHDLAANNHGFQSRVDYPYAAAENDFVVIILGGSVASGLGYSEAFTHVISEKLNLALGGRRAVVLNMATAGFKQPQQISVLGYYLSAGQKVDVVVNLDGVNEAVSGSRNFDKGVAIEMPPIDVMGPWYSQLEGQTPMSAVSVAVLYHTAVRNAETERAEKCRFAVCYVWHRMLASWQQRYIRNGESELLSLPGRASAFVLYKSHVDQKNEFGAIADLWERSSRTLDAMARSVGAACIHVLQPDQYYATARKFTPEETGVAFDQKSHVKLPIEKAYPLFVQKIAKLQESGIAAVDGTRIFDAEPHSIYVDTCCHTNELGNRLLGAFVAESIIKQLKLPITR